jgi:hypothetical protein
MIFNLHMVTFQYFVGTVTLTVRLSGFANDAIRLTEAVSPTKLQQSQQNPWQPACCNAGIFIKGSLL